MPRYIIYHNSCSEAVIKFVRAELHTHKPPLQDDINLESMLNQLRSAISQQTVVIGSLGPDHMHWEGSGAT